MGRRWMDNGCARRDGWSALVRNTAAAGVLLAAVGGLSGCGGEVATVAEVREGYGERFVEGMSLGSVGEVRAEGYDTREGQLVSVTIDMGDRGLIHARRAAIVIDAEARTMRLRLMGVTVAAAGSAMESRDEVWTDAVRLDRAMVASAGD